MVRRLLLASVFLGLAGFAVAQPPDAPILELQTRDAPAAAGPRVRLFISPMGEPFRGADGFGVWLAGADADHDGAVTQAEFRADGERFFHVLDSNGDGILDGFEMQAYERERVPEIGGVNVDQGSRRGGRGFFGRRKAPSGADSASKGPSAFRGAGREGAARFSLLNIAQPVANADQDWNGRVTLKEWDHVAAGRFDVLDKAKTGRLSRDSLRPAVPETKTR